MNDSLIPEQILTVSGFGEFKLKEKGSSFIGQVYPTGTADEAETFLTGIRKEFFDATHHCYCYKLASKNEKYSDGGEPSGTAGIRLLNAIDHFGLTNLLVVVIRYYGGVKLGVGPLGRTYYQTAFNLLQTIDKRSLSPFKKSIIYVDVSFTKTIYNILNINNSRITKNGYDSGFFIEALIPVKNIESIQEEIASLTKGKAKLKLDPDIVFFEKE